LSRILWILYEDQLSGAPKGYGPHALVTQCLADRRGLERRKLEAVLRSRPLKGNGNVLRDSKQNFRRLSASGPVFAVYDDDKIRELLKLPHQACKAQVTACLQKDCEAPEALVIVLLERNIETVIETIFKIEPGIHKSDVRESATQKKNLNDRDMVLHAAAAPDKRRMRDDLLNQMPSLRRLVEKLDAALGHLA
jgi:hypothetical protein